MITLNILKYKTRNIIMYENPYVTFKKNYLIVYLDNLIKFWQFQKKTPKNFRRKGKGMILTSLPSSNAAIIVLSRSTRGGRLFVVTFRMFTLDCVIAVLISSSLGSRWSRSRKMIRWYINEFGFSQTFFAQACFVWKVGRSFSHIYNNKK